MQVLPLTLLGRVSTGRPRLSRSRRRTRPRELEVLDVGPLAQRLAGWREPVVVTLTVWRRLAEAGATDAIYRDQPYVHEHVRSMLVSAAAAARHGPRARFHVRLPHPASPIGLELRRTVGPRGRLVVVDWPTDSI